VSDFQFLQNPISKIWVVLAPRRSKRPDISREQNFVCPFCPGNEAMEKEAFRIPSSSSVIPSSSSVIPGSSSVIPGSDPGSTQIDSRFLGNDYSSNWEVRVLTNKFPFAPIHEIIIHSPDHHKNFDELPIMQVEKILWVYRQRFQVHQAQGNPYIFNNHGQAGGESIPHPHTQLVVIPQEVHAQIQPLVQEEESYEAKYFHLFCPSTSQWPDEVWVAPKRKDTNFGEIEDEELSDLAIILQRLIQLFTMRHGHEFAFNFYIYPGKNWYLRFMPRTKSLGGFEIGTGVFVNTQDPKETLRFIKSNFENKEITELEEENKADFAMGV